MDIDLQEHFGKSWTPVVARIIALEDSDIEIGGDNSSVPSPGALRTARLLVRRLRELNTAFPTGVTVTKDSVALEWFRDEDGVSLEARVVAEGRVLWQYFVPMDNLLQRWEENWIMGAEERLDES